ncbi:hypothetical protein Tco_1173578, partial [Tanacetum coccineum]
LPGRWKKPVFDAFAKGGRQSNFDPWTSYIDKVILADFAILEGKYNNVIYAQLSLGLYSCKSRYLFLESSLAGLFYLSDSCRIGENEALKELKSIGIKTSKLMGECEAAANQERIQVASVLIVCNQMQPAHAADL